MASCELRGSSLFTSREGVTASLADAHGYFGRKASRVDSRLQRFAQPARLTAQPYKKLTDPLGNYDFCR
jgi:hypothetical protein